MPQSADWQSDQCWPINSKADKQINCHVNTRQHEQRITTATDTQSKTEPWKTSSSLSLLSILRHGVSFLLWLPFRQHTHTHTHRLTMLLPVKVSKAARWKSEKQRVMQMLNGEWKMLSCWRFAVHSTWQRHVDWPAQPPLCDVKQNPDQIWYSYLCGINMHIYIYIYIHQSESVEK